MISVYDEVRVERVDEERQVGVERDVQAQRLEVCERRRTAGGG